MKIYLVQHGEAEAREIDPERPLTARGTADVQRVAGALKATGVSVGRVIHSGKLRARQSAELLADAIAPGIEPEVSDRINPNDDPDGLHVGDILADTLIVGHLPFMARLAALMLTGDRDLPLVAYRPGSVVCLESNGGDNWQLNWMLRPEILV